MQTVSANLQTILRRKSSDLASLVEIYHYNAVPTSAGFDPAQADFVAGFAAVSGAANSIADDAIAFRNRRFERRVRSFGSIKRHITKEQNTFSCELGNEKGDIAALEFDFGFEGLILVVRLVSRSLTVSNSLREAAGLTDNLVEPLAQSDNLDDSIVLFVGRCDALESFDRSSNSARITARQIIGSIEQSVPRRTFQPDDEKGRHPTDPLFEGFRFSAVYGNVQYAVRERRGGLLGFLGFKKNVTYNLQYSSHSDLNASRAVPEIFGRAQISSVHVGYVDTGTEIRVLTAFCEGPVKDLVEVRSVTAGFDINPLAYGELRGYPGGTYDQFPDPNWVAPGYYSRTAHVRAGIRGSAQNVDDPAPDIVGKIIGRIIPVPDQAGTAYETEHVDWTDNPVHIARFLLTDPDYFNLTTNLVDDRINLETARYCDEKILDQSGTDTIFLPASQATEAGRNYDLYLPTSTVTAERLKLESTGAGSFAPTRLRDAVFKPADYQFYEQNAIPVDPVDPRYPGDDGGGGTGRLPIPAFKIRNRYTANVTITDQQKLVDFLFDVLFPAFRGFLVFTPQGKAAIKTAKPVDFTFLRAPTNPGAAALPVLDVEKWRADQSQRLLIGANLPSGEVRAVTGAIYTTASNSITLGATGVSQSGATFTGADAAGTTTALASITVDGALDETMLVVIDGYGIEKNPAAGDTQETIAGFIAAAVEAHPVLKFYIRAVWTGTNVVTFYSKLGSLLLDAPLGNAHSSGLASPAAAPTGAASAGGNLAAGDWNLSYSFETASGETQASPPQKFTLTGNQKITVDAIAPPAGAKKVNWYFSIAGGTTARLRRLRRNNGESFVITEAANRLQPMEPQFNQTREEVMRVAYVLNESNTLKGSFKLRQQKASVNQIIIEYRDSVQDFKLTRLIINDTEHQARVKKKLPKTISGAAIDNFHQAKRIGNGILGEEREGSRFTDATGDGEALLLEEGDVVVISDDGTGLRYLPVRIEAAEIELSRSHPSIRLAARRYSRAFYDDDVDEKPLTLPTILTNLDRDPLTYEGEELTINLETIYE